MNQSSTRRGFLEHAGRSAAASAAATAWSAIRLEAAENASPAGRRGKRIKVGQIGVGHAHAEGKMNALRKSDDWDVVGVVEPSDELRRAAEQSEVYRGLSWITEEQLLDDPNVQAVVVETTVDGLLDAAERAVDAGKHIHLDKPAGADLKRFERILNNADRQGLTVQMGYMYRYNPGIVLLRDLLEQGLLGEVFEVHAVMSKQVGAAKRRKLARFSGGTMFELGCHLVDLVVGILGPPDAVTPYARQTGSFDDTLLDNMLAVLEYPQATATVKSTALEVEGFDRRHLVVCGTEGTLHVQPLDDPQVRLALSKPHGPYQDEYQTIDVGVYERYIDDMADLAKIVRGEKQSDFDSAHDRAVQQAVLQAAAMT